jgi:signal transduction histidine kinase
LLVHIEGIRLKTDIQERARNGSIQIVVSGQALYKEFYSRGQALTSIIAKRQTMHRQLAQQRQQNEALTRDALQLESLANLGSAMAMIAHEINNLLTPLTNFAELALQNPEDRVLTERALRKTTQNCRQAGKVMEGILALANAGIVETVETPLLPLVNGVFDCLCRDFKKDGITVEIRVSENLSVWCVPVQLQQAMMNLILNAREAMAPRGGVLTVEAEEKSGDIRIRISDTGCGIEQSEMKRVFDTFFTTKQKSSSGRPGSGLGLALCKKVIEGHNGSITVDSQPGRGTTFTIILPKARERTKPPAVGAADEH